MAWGWCVCDGVVVCCCWWCMQEAAKRYEVFQMPTFIFLRNGQVLGQVSQAGRSVG
jgi:hypothetical protein